MNQAHLHLILNHFPIIGTIIGALVLLAGLLFKGAVTKRIGLFILIFSSLFAFPALLTGEGAEEVLEGLAGVSKALIEEHEELAGILIWMTSFTGVIALITLLFSYFKSRFARWLGIITAIVSIVTVVFAARVGLTGGEIRHTEIRSDFSENATDQDSNDNYRIHKEEDEDD